MGMIDLTPEQEEALFPEVPDYFIVDGKIYKPTIADHIEYYSGKVDDCSYYRITLNETTDSDTFNEVNKQLRKEGREGLKRSTESWLDELMKAHPWINENGLVLQGKYEDGQIDKVRLTMNSQILATITVKQIMIIQKLLASILEQCNERTVFEIVDNVIERDEWRKACDSNSKEIMIDIK